MYIMYGIVVLVGLGKGRSPVVSPLMVTLCSSDAVALELCNKVRGGG
jgi:hypothetical protein